MKMYNWVPQTVVVLSSQSQTSQGNLTVGIRHSEPVLQGRGLRVKPVRFRLSFRLRWIISDNIGSHATGWG